jgi:superfamily I DNA/RNA helicase
MKQPAKNDKEVRALLHLILKFLGPERIRLIYPEYRQGQWFEELLEQVVKYLTKSCKTTDNWEAALDDFAGRDTIPIMTIHKSKGLEYHTIVFVGLDDAAWWSFRTQPEESRSAFFVAFSRAKQRILFTYCEQRGGRKEIASLYEVLQSAGVTTKTFK